MKKVLWVALASLLVSGSAIAQALIYPPDYHPPPCTGIYFDYPCPSDVYVNWAEALFNEGFTSGTSGPGDPITFSPNMPIPRNQAAVWVLRAEHSILERFGVGTFVCGGGNITEWAKCSGDIDSPSVHPTSNVQCTYNTRGGDDQIPCRVFNVHEGGFSVELQTGQTISWLSFTP